MSDAKKQSIETCKYRHNWTRNTDVSSPYPKDSYPIVCAACGTLPKSKEVDEAEAIVDLREMIKPGDTVYTVLRSVSRSGMSRNIDVYIMRDNEPVWITGRVGHAIGTPQSRKDWEHSAGLRVSGCGMDMGFHVVNSLSEVLYGQTAGGYKCLGKGKCPSNYHVNHRDTIQCDGIPRYFVWWLDADGGELVKAGPFDTREQAEKDAATRPTHKTAMGGEREPEVEADYIQCWKSDTVMLEPLLLKGIEVSRGHAHTIRRTEDGPEEICPTCNGEGKLPNPHGPQKFNLTHTDGYALRHKWM